MAYIKCKPMPNNPEPCVRCQVQPAVGGTVFCATCLREFRAEQVVKTEEAK